MLATQKPKYLNAQYTLETWRNLYEEFSYLNFST